MPQANAKSPASPGKEKHGFHPDEARRQARVHNSLVRPKGSLIIVGGHEDLKGESRILREVVAHLKKGPLVICPVASQNPEGMISEYRQVFSRLGVRELESFDIRTRQDAMNPEPTELLSRATALFLTGGDQLRISSQVGDSLLFGAITELYQRGGTVIGTSAGAAVMSETMMISGDSDTSNRVSAVDMAPGLALLPHVIIDTHFAERGRIGRLIGAVTQNPSHIGLGLDEDTAVIVHGDRFRVVGSGAVYLVNGNAIRYSTLSEANPKGVLTVTGVCLDILAEGDEYDLLRREALPRTEKSRDQSAA